MKYTHPDKYKGVKFDTPTNQRIVKDYVEANCIKCSLFMGKEHDFSECNSNILSAECTCPEECRKGVPLY